MRESLAIKHSFSFLNFCSQEKQKTKPKKRSCHPRKLVCFSFFFLVGRRRQKKTKQNKTEMFLRFLYNDYSFLTLYEAKQRPIDHRSSSLLHSHRNKNKVLTFLMATNFTGEEESETKHLINHIEAIKLKKKQTNGRLNWAFRIATKPKVRLSELRPPPQVTLMISGRVGS